MARNSGIDTTGKGVNLHEKKNKIKFLYEPIFIIIPIFKFLGIKYSLMIHCRMIHCRFKHVYENFNSYKFLSYLF